MLLPETPQRTTCQKPIGLCASRCGRQRYRIPCRGRPAFQKFGAKFIVRGGAFEAMEGTARERNVVVEFKDRATACRYASPEYQ